MVIRAWPAKDVWPSCQQLAWLKGDDDGMEGACMVQVGVMQCTHACDRVVHGSVRWGHGAATMVAAVAAGVCMAAWLYKAEEVAFGKVRVLAGMWRASMPSARIKCPCVHAQVRGPKVCCMTQFTKGKAHGSRTHPKARYIWGYTWGCPHASVLPQPPSA